MVILLASCDHRPKNKYTSDVYIDTGEPYQVYYKGKKAGMLDRKGHVLLPAQFGYIDEYSYDHLVKVDSGGYDLKGMDVKGHQFKKYGIVTDRGEILFRPMFDQVTISDHMILVKIDSLYGYTNDKGTWVVKPRFEDARPFEGGAAIVKIGDKFTLIKKDGKVMLNRYFDELWNFKNGVSVVADKGKYGFINHKGEIIAPIRYNGIGEYNWNYGQLYIKNKTYLVDTSGKIFNMPFDTVNTYEGKNHTTIAKGQVKGKFVELTLK